jgi:hypothetical protein
MRLVSSELSQHSGAPSFMNKLGILGSLSAMFFTSMAYAVDTGWASFERYVQSGSQTQVYLDGVDNTCSAAFDNIYRLDESAAGSEAMSKLLLSAFLAGKEVYLTYSCSAGQNAFITAVRLRP